MTDATSSAATAAPGERRRYAAFISYCHADSQSAGALQRFLETYRLPRDVADAETDRSTLQARLRPVFLDRADMPAGTDLRGEIDAALAASAALIVVCSPAAAKSRWVNLEIERFRQQHGDDRIFAVIIDGIAHASEHAASADRECFPPALRLRETPDGPVRADPAAVDLRRTGDGMQVGRLRLVAGLVGVPLDQLVHRDARRRHRRTLALLIGLSLALAGTSALALVCFGRPQRSPAPAVRRRRHDRVHDRGFKEDARTDGALVGDGSVGKASAGLLSATGRRSP